MGVGVACNGDGAEPSANVQAHVVMGRMAGRMEVLIRKVTEDMTSMASGIGCMQGV